MTSDSRRSISSAAVLYRRRPRDDLVRFGTTPLDERRRVAAELVGAWGYACEWGGVFAGESSGSGGDGSWSVAGPCCEDVGDDVMSCEGGLAAGMDSFGGVEGFLSGCGAGSSDGQSVRW